MRAFGRNRTCNTLDPQPRGARDQSSWTARSRSTGAAPSDLLLQLVRSRAAGCSWLREQNREQGPGAVPISWPGGSRSFAQPRRGPQRAARQATATQDARPVPGHRPSPARSRPGRRAGSAPRGPVTGLVAGRHDHGARPPRRATSSKRRSGSSRSAAVQYARSAAMPWIVPPLSGTTRAAVGGGCTRRRPRSRREHLRPHGCSSRRTSTARAGAPGVITTRQCRAGGCAARAGWPRRAALP